MTIRSWRILCLAVAGVTLAAATAPAQEVVVRNDSLEDFGQGAIQVGFVSGESAAAWMTSPCDGDITKVQVLWLSLLGGAPASLEESITVFEAGPFPVPGPVRTELLGPVMTDGVLNEFTLPAPLPVSVGEEFVVSFKFFNSPPALGPSVVTDADGCQTPLNGLFAIPPSVWFDSCALGVSGDFVIRAVVDCSLPPVSLTFSPADGDIIRSARWDLGIVADVPAGTTITDVSGTLNGLDISPLLAACTPGAFPLGDGVTLRCPIFHRELTPGTANTLSVMMDFSSGASAAGSVTWNVLRNNEP